MDRILNRQKKKEEYSKRGSKLSQKRMQTIAELGMDDESNQVAGGMKQKKQIKDKDKDTFGMADEDWDIYRGIQKDNYSEEEEDD